MTNVEALVLSVFISVDGTLLVLCVVTATCVVVLDPFTVLSVGCEALVISEVLITG